VLEYDGKYYLADGTHRATAAYLRGDQTIKAEVYPVDPEKVKNPPTGSSVLDTLSPPKSPTATTVPVSSVIKPEVTPKDDNDIAGAFAGMGGAVTNNLYQRMLDRLQAGQSVHDPRMGKPPLAEQVVQRAWDTGQIKSLEDVKRFAQMSIEDARAHFTQPESPATTAVAEARANVNTTPTDGQKEAGNYKKGHVTLHGLDISIENPKGAERTGVSKDGTKWSVTMPADYGYIKRTEGADGDHVDVYIGPDPDSTRVFVIDQIDPATGEFDEHKAVLGVHSQAGAQNLYVRGFSDGKGVSRIGGITEMSVDEFREWATSGDTSKPLAKKQAQPRQDSKKYAGAPKPKVAAEMTDAELAADIIAQVERENSERNTARKPEPSPEPSVEPSGKGSPNVSAKVTYNLERHSIEVGFARKPDADVLARLKGAGFKWAKTNKVWYDRLPKGVDAQRFLREARELIGLQADTPDTAGPKADTTSVPATPAPKPVTPQVEPKWKAGLPEFVTAPHAKPAGTSEPVTLEVRSLQTGKTDEVTLPPATSQPEDARAAIKAKRADIIKQLKANLANNINSGVDPQNVVLMVKLTRTYIDEGILVAKDAYRAFLEDFGDGADRLNRHFELAWQKLRGEAVKVADFAGQPDSVDTSATEAETQTEEPNADTQQPGTQDQGALAGASAEDDGRPDSRGETGSVGPRGGAADTERGSGSDSARNEPGSGEGTDAGAVGVPAGRGDGTGPRRGPARVARTGNTGLDYVITDDAGIGAGGPSQKLAANVAAITLLKQLEAEGRKATADEQAILAKYVGWGGISRAFLPNTQENKALRAAGLTDEEYDAAAASTTNAHYTSVPVIRAMWSAVDRLGFSRGRVLEPSVGVGNFFGAMPFDLGARTTWAGIELDPLTARIAQQLYQTAHIQNVGFEAAKLPEGFFDLAVGNVPFGNYGVHDASYKGKRNFLTSRIHNYFFAKAIDKVRPGGLVAFITSRYSMDAKDTGVRAYLASKADLLGAIRLPRQAFMGNAGTEVVTDILFLRRRADGETAGDASWVRTGPTTIGGFELSVNQYFLDHPEMVLGTQSLEGSMYSDGELTVNYEGDIAKGLDGLVAKLPEAVMTYEAPAATEPSVDELVPAPDHVKPYAFTEQDGKLFVRIGDNLESQEGLPDATKARIRGMMGVRDRLRETMRTMLGDDSSPAQIKQAQKRLNAVYDSFVKKFGYISEVGNVRAMSDDPDKPLLLSLEKWNQDTGTAEKADIFSKRTLSPRTPPTSADSPNAALLISLNETGRVDWTRMSSLTKQSATELQDALKGIVFKTPSGEWQTADEYLSGNVRVKLTEAENAVAIDPEYRDNVEALKAVQPEDLPPSQIDARLGSSWVPVDDVKAFLGHITDTNARRFTVHYLAPLGAWSVEADSITTAANTTRWGSAEFTAARLIDQALNLKSPTAYDRTADGKSVVNQKRTLEAREKQQAIKDEFKRWLWADPERADRLSRKYNDEFNNLAPRRFDGAHLQLPGVSANVTLRPHQKNAIWRVLQAGNTLLAHVVGAGKTFAVAGSAMEMRRLGIAKKPMIVVPNHLVEQWGAEFIRMYPTANVLIAGKKDFEKEHRQRLMSRIATGNWDAVVVAHSSFGRIGVSDDLFNGFIQEQIDILENFLNEMKASGKLSKKSGSVKEIEKAKKRLEKKLKDRADRENKDITLTFEELGVDSLFVDEAHLFKNLWFATKMTRVAGLPNTESDRAFDMFLKTRFISQRSNGKGVIFATGTPVSNTMAETFTMQRYLQLPTLEQYGLAHFDAWAQSFGETVTSLELSPEGTGYRPRTRFAEFTNLPELAKMFRQVADVLLADDLKLPVPKIKGGKPETVVTKPSKALAMFMESLVKRAEKVRGGKVDPRVDNMLKITSEGKKAALDMRLLGGGYPLDPSGKVPTAVENIAAIYHENTHRKGTQLVFLDMGTPKKAKGEDVSIDDSPFNLYQDIKDRLIARGIPAKDIAFIHDANTDARKIDLFRKVNSGDIRILLGSTEKMGAGTNVQAKLVALHHLDAPWRPADIEQREGRIIRQGNEFYAADPKGFEIRVLRYVTERSFDAYMWQTLETKAKFINTIMRGDMTVRRAADIEGGALNAAEVKALASGNPLVFEKVKVDAELRKLETLKAAHQDQLVSARRELARLPQSIEWWKGRLASAERFIATRAVPTEFAITIGKQTFTERDAADLALKETAWASLKGTGKAVQKIGRYAGLDILVRRADERGTFKEPIIQAAVPEDHDIAYAAMGQTLGSFEYAVRNRPEGSVADATRTIADEQKRLEGMKQEVDRPFPQQARYDELVQKAQALDKELNLDAKSQATEAPAVEAEDDEGDDDTTGTMRLPSDVDRVPYGHSREIPIAPATSKYQAERRHAPSAIEAKLMKALGGIPARVGRLGVPARGIFKTGPNTIRLKQAHDLRAVFHEAGHAFDITILKIDRKDKRWKQELTDLGQATSKPSYAPGQVRKEGAAEFFHLYLLDPAEAQALAPAYFAEFERRLNDHAELRDALHDVRRDLEGFKGLSDADRGRLRINRDAEPGILRRVANDPKSTIRTFARTMVDDLQPIREAVDQMRDGRDLPARENAWKLARIARGAAGKAEAFLEHGVRGQGGKFIAGSLADAIAPVREHMEDFEHYMVALRVLELADRGMAGGMTPREAHAIVVETEQRDDFETFKQARDNVYLFQGATLEYARQYGAFSDDATGPDRQAESVLRPDAARHGRGRGQHPRRRKAHREPNRASEAHQRLRP
jgi:N12 class adenine-specific DNA methylase